MKVILLQDVAKIGKRFSVAEVPDGYALNQLIPKRMAEPATPVNLKRIERLQAEKTAHEAADQAALEKAKDLLQENPLTVAMEANEQGHLFKAVNAADIVSVAKEKGIHVEESAVKIASPIKEVGEHAVELVSERGVSSFTINVTKK